MRGKLGFRQTRSYDNRIVLAGIDADTGAILVNTASPASLNLTNAEENFFGFQTMALPANTPTATLPVVRVAHNGRKFALLPYMPDSPGVTPTMSEVLLSVDSQTWISDTLPVRDIPDTTKHAWAEIYGRNGRFIVSHNTYPDLAISDDEDNWTLLQDVFATTGFQTNGISSGNGILLAAADNAQVVYRSLDNGLTWSIAATGITINEFSAVPTNKALDRILALTYGWDGAANVFFMLARRDDVTRFRYVLTSPDGSVWTQRLRVDLGTTGTPQEPLIAGSPVRTMILFNNLTTATTLVTTTTAWTQLTTTPAANWRALTYDGAKFIATGESFNTTSAPIVMTLTPNASILAWSTKLTGTQKLRAVSVGATIQPPRDNSVTLLLRMVGSNGSNVFQDSSPDPKTISAVNVVLSDEQFKWSNTLSAKFPSSNSGARLDISYDPGLAMGTANFTIEAWVWLFSYRGSLWDSSPRDRVGNEANDGFSLDFDTFGRLRLLRKGVWLATTDTNIVPLTTWAHVALVRHNNVSTIYVNGETRATTTTIFNDSAGLPPRVPPLVGNPSIGRLANSSASLNGYVGEFRITKGVAHYTTTFTPPTAPFLDYTP